MKKFIRILTSLVLVGVMATASACIEYPYQTPGAEQQAAMDAPVHIDLSGQGITCERLAEMVYSGAIPAYVTHLN